MYLYIKTVGKPDKMAEIENTTPIRPVPTFKHFDPIHGATGKTIAPNFTKNVDVFNPKKNIPLFESLAVTLGIGAAKTIVLKNTFKFFQTKEVPQNKNRFVDKLGKPCDKSMPIVGYSDFGFPIFSNLTLLGDSYQDNSGQTIGTFDTVILDAVLMDISNDNNIVSTDVQGRNGTVIEYISSKSWYISVRGRLLAKCPGVYPLDSSNDDKNKPKGDNLNNMIAMLNCNKAIRVQSWFLNAAGIHNIVIRHKNFPQEEGSQEYQKFEFEAISDKPVILKMVK